MMSVMKKDFYIGTKRILSSTLKGFAKRIRSEMGLSPTDKFNPLSFLECYLQDRLHFTLEIISVEEWTWKDGRVAYCNPVENKVYIRENVYNGAMNGNLVDRMTVCHEGCHMFLFNEVGFVRVDKDNYDFCTKEHKIDAKGDKRFGNPEVQADFLAECLFCTPDILKSAKNLKDLVSKTGMQKSCAKRRLSERNKRKVGNAYSKKVQVTAMLLQKILQKNSL